MACQDAPALSRTSDPVVQFRVCRRMNMLCASSTHCLAHHPQLVFAQRIRTHLFYYVSGLKRAFAPTSDPHARPEVVSSGVTRAQYAFFPARAFLHYLTSCSRYHDSSAHSFFSYSLPRPFSPYTVVCDAVSLSSSCSVASSFSGTRSCSCYASWNPLSLTSSLAASPPHPHLGGLGLGL